jgi:integrase
MAHIRRHPNKPDSWQVRYIDPAGRERSKGGFRRKIDAEKYAHHIEAQKQRGEWIDPDNASTIFGEWAAQWIDTRAHLKPKTLAGYESLLRSHVVPRFGTARLDRIDPLEVESWVADMQSAGLSPSRIRQAHQVLNAILKAAVRNRYLPSNPAEGIRLPRSQKREMLYLTPEQVEKLAQTISEPYGALVHVLAYGGLRWGEAAALRRRRVDVLRSRIEVAESLAEVGGLLSFGSTKSHRSRFVSLPVSLRDLLNDHLAASVESVPNALVFTAQGRRDRPGDSDAAQPLRHSNFTQRVWKPAVREAGLPEGLRMHDLRHTCAALLIDEGAHPEHIKRHLGHSSITVTMDTYGHLYPDAEQALSDRLDARIRAAQTDRRRTLTGDNLASVGA